jgi:hypothetical protein
MSSLGRIDIDDITHDPYPTSLKNDFIWTIKHEYQFLQVMIARMQKVGGDVGEAVDWNFRMWNERMMVEIASMFHDSAKDGGWRAAIVRDPHLKFVPFQGVVNLFSLASPMVEARIFRMVPFLTVNPIAYRNVSALGVLQSVSTRLRGIGSDEVGSSLLFQNPDVSGGQERGNGSKESQDPLRPSRWREWLAVVRFVIGCALFSLGVLLTERLDLDCKRSQLIYCFLLTFSGSVLLLVF